METDRPGEESSAGSESSSDGLETDLMFLEISSQGLKDDETFLSPDTASLVSSTSEESITSKPNSREKLNEYLVSKNIEPVSQPWVEWEKASDSTKLRYTRRTAEIFSSVLHDQTPSCAGSLWQAVVSYPAMNEALGLDELSETSKCYLQVLAEAYDKAHGWDTRRQILSMMSGVSNYNDISRFVPGLSRYRFTIANLHRLQHGSGASVTPQPSSKIRVDPRQLDHFLSYITSPHLVQDLPFGQKTLKLSSGQLVEVPNVIRTMIPQRIVRQYTQYCKETGFEAFSERTMLRVLNECKASTRKSLQGLDYFAADGARAFDELEGLGLQLGELGRGKEWQVRYVKSKCEEFQENWIMLFKQGDLISQMDGSMARKNRSDDRSTQTGNIYVGFCSWYSFFISINYACNRFYLLRLLRLFDLDNMKHTYCKYFLSLMLQ